MRLPAFHRHQAGRIPGHLVPLVEEVLDAGEQSDRAIELARQQEIDGREVLDRDRIDVVLEALADVATLDHRVEDLGVAPAQPQHDALLGHLRQAFADELPEAAARSRSRTPRASRSTRRSSARSDGTRPRARSPPPRRGPRLVRWRQALRGGTTPHGGMTSPAGPATATVVGSMRSSSSFMNPLRRPKKRGEG